MRRCIAYVALVWTIVPLGDAVAMTAKFTPFIAFEQEYTDNVELAPEGEEAGASVSQLTPGFEVTTDGPLVQLDALYQMQNIFYANDRYDDETFHYFDGKGTLNIVRDRVFVEGFGSYTQRAIDPAEPFGFSNVSRFDNRTDVSLVGVRPYWREQLGTSAYFEAGYRREDVDYRTAGALDSETTGYDFVVAKLDPADEIGWEATYDQEEVKADGTAIRLEKAQLQMSYRLSGKTRFIGIVGGENNEFTTSDDEVPEGRFWSAGFEVEPSSRNRITLLTGERYFGRTYAAEWDRKGRYASLSARYFEELTTAALSDVDSFVTSAGEPAAVDGTVARPTADVYLRKRGEAAFDVDVSKMVLHFGVASERRDYSSGLDEDVDSVSGRLEWSMTGRTVISVIVDWRRYDRADLASESEETQVMGVMARRLSPQTKGYVRIRRAEGHGSGDGRDYVENALAVGVKRDF